MEETRVLTPRQVPVYNASGADIPAHSFARITGRQASGALTIAKPNANSMSPVELVITGAAIIKDGAAGGLATPAETGKMLVLYNGAAPGNGDDFGSVSGQWYGEKNKLGFICHAADAGNTRARVSPRFATTGDGGSSVPDAGDTIPLIVSKAGDQGTQLVYMRDDAVPGLKLVGTPDDVAAESYATLEFATGDDGLQVKFDPADFQASSDGLALAAAGGPPTGTILAHCGASAPTGYLVCDASAKSRTTYGDLFAETGETYGAGDGSTTFNLPAGAGKIMRGNTPGTGGGSDTHANSIPNLGIQATGGGSPSTDSAQAQVQDHGTTRYDLALAPPDGEYVVGSANAGHTMSGHAHPLLNIETMTGTSGSANNIPANTGVLWIIKT